jgi:GDP-L-galactose phosphorylase
MGEVSQELLDTQVNPAVWEISGHIVLKRRNDYEEASETSAWNLLAEVSLSEERFEEVKAYVFTAAGLVQSDEVEVVSKGEDIAYVPVNPLPVTEGCLVLQ